jgi:Membrane-associating domain
MPLQFLWTLLILALVGNVIAEANAGNPSIINYDMFVAVFSMLSLFFLAASAFTGAMSGTPIPLALDVLNTLFVFCGAVAMAAELGAHSCTDNVRLPISTPLGRLSLSPRLPTPPKS